MYFLIARNYTTCTIIYPMVYKNLVYIIYVRHAHISNIKQLLDEVEHDIINYQNRGLCYRHEVLIMCYRHEVLIIHDIMRKPNSIIVLLYIFHINSSWETETKHSALTSGRRHSTLNKRTPLNKPIVFIVFLVLLSFCLLLLYASCVFYTK